MESSAKKIRPIDVKPGKFYVSRTGWLIREIVKEQSLDDIYWRDWFLDTGVPIADRLALCSKRTIATWAGREATEEEIARLDRSPLKFEVEFSRLIDELVNWNRQSERQRLAINTGRMLALFVGVNEYADPHIPNLTVCVNDATSVCQIFSRQPGKSTLLSDAGFNMPPIRNNIIQELINFSRAAQEDDLLLFYFSGHGMVENGQSYLLPRDVSFPILKYTAVSMGDVREIINDSSARAKVVILDACHSGAAIGKAMLTMTSEFLQNVFEEAEGMAILASCKQGEVSWEWHEANTSVFTHYLLEALLGHADSDQKGFITVSDVSKYVTNGVKEWSVANNRSQTPTLQAEIVGDIVLVKPVP